MIINYKVQFLHIPRTGGTFLSFLFSQKYLCDHTNFDEFFKDCSVPHLNMVQSNSFFCSSKIFKTFTVVRNPVTRFISCLKNTNKINKRYVKYMFENETNFFNTMYKLRKSKTDNFFEPQINFIENDTKIWKFENGFEKEFNAWLVNNLDIELPKVSENEIKNFLKKNNSNYKFDFTLNEEQIQYIKNYYFLDYKILGY